MISVVDASAYHVQTRQKLYCPFSSFVVFVFLFYFLVSFLSETKSMVQRIFLGQLMISQLIRKFWAFMELEDLLRCSHKSSLDHVLSQLNPVHTLTPCFFKIPFVILTSSSRSPNEALSFSFSDHNLVQIYNFPYACYMSQPPHPSWFNYINNIR
jgi:hypothetical protein